MTIDVHSLRTTIRRLEDEVAVLRRIADEAEQQQAPQAGESVSLGVQLPPEIKVPRPAAVEAFLQDRPALAQLVSEMAPAILREFAGEPSQVVFDLYEDPEIDDRYLVYYVRLPEYDDGFTDRLEQISSQFYGRTGGADDWVLISTDFHDIA